MKKLFAILLCIALCFATAALAACGGDTGDGGDASGLTKDNIKIGFVHITDPSDMGYTYNHDLGTQKMAQNIGLSDSQIINKFNIPEGSECETAVRELVEAGCNIIVATSFGHADYMLTVAAEYPDIVFAHATGYHARFMGLDNYHNYFVDIFEARYLAGIAAGLKTETNKLGYVAAFPFAEVISGYTSFYLGAKSVNPDVTMEVMYANSWHDPATEAQVAQALIDRGADVISQHSDSTAPATTAEANGVWHVGYNADMIPAAPNASLVSARADWSIYLTMLVQDVLDGKDIPADWSEGLAANAVFLSPLNDAIVADGTAAAIDAAKAQIIGGFHVFSGHLKDNDGNNAKITTFEGDLIYEFTGPDSYFIESNEFSAPDFNPIIEGIFVMD
ncbi:MAG: BMP family ABC transporter substrate-binding protein [Oscillospiraceae bacterium]|nr:BMP family ABC transporter substrate-binding protein [Oscillospiraceae bacterium]